MPAYQVTLTSSGTTYDLVTLIKAIDSKFRDGGDFISIQPENDAGAQVFHVGQDPNLSDTRYGYKLTASSNPIQWSAGGPGWVYLAGWKARCDTPAKMLNINISR